MSGTPFTIKPFGQTALLLEWPKRVEVDILMDILGFREYLLKRHLLGPDWELTPVYHSLTLINRSDPAAIRAIIELLPKWYSSLPAHHTPETQYWELPVCYEAALAPDLIEVSEKLGMDPQEVIEAHTGQPYRVYGIGFLPGFLYLGGVPEVLKLERRAEPRLHVDKGSVGLAGAQTGIYPQVSPGGWHIIGSCPVPLFTPDKTPPCVVAPGDQVRFRAVERAEYDLHKLESEIGIYNYKTGHSSA
ncbi:MAG: 5-oxoprolinase subunit PxpB [Robiginitalea sp.]|uniref:5-oxoprolinase subunit PxpB n=1 Tax=Robiginitalea sp. TaxID=1902411 RepID=UPI003C74DF45